jgi:hypothetical protein
MPQFALAYRNPAGYTRTAEPAAAWRAWFASMGDQLAHVGKPADGDETAGGDTECFHGQLAAGSLPHPS